MSTLAKAYVQIVPTTKGLSAGIEKEMDPAGERAGGLLAGSMKKVLGKAAIGAAVVGGIAAAVKEGGKLEQSIGGIETLFKDDADIVKKNASMAFKEAGISANAYMENTTSFAASLISSLGGDTKAAADLANTAMIDMSDNANKMGTDMESIQQTYQSLARGNFGMLDNLKLGYGGTKSEMERLMADAEKLTGEHYTVGDFADTVSAIHAIQDSLEITGTTAKEASTTLAGSFGMMKASATDLLGSLVSGDDVGTAMTNLVESITVFLADNLIPALGRLIQAIPPALIALIKAVFTTLLPELLMSVGEAVAGILDSLFLKLSELWDKIKEIISSVWTSIKETISTIVQEISDKITGIWEEIKLGISQKIDEISIAISTTWTNIKDGISEILTGIKDKFTEIWDGIKLKVSDVIDEVKNKISTTLGAVKESVTSILDGVKNKFTEVWDGVKIKVSSVIDEVKNKISTTLGAAKDTVTDKLDGIKLKFENIFNGIKTFLSPILDWLKKIFDFKWELPKIKLPHFKIDGEFSLNPPSIPSFSIDWYKTGGIFNKASVIGVGEAGSEAVLPLDNFYRYMDGKMASRNDSNVTNINIEMIINAAQGQDAKQIADEVTRKIYDSIARKKAVFA